MRRLSLQALGGAQSVAIGAFFLVVTLGAMAAIGLFVHAAARDNASAVLHEKAVTELHILLRGLNEAVVSQGALASMEMVSKAVAAFDETRILVASRSDGDLLGGFAALKERIATLMSGRRNVAFDDNAMIAVGRISSEVEKMIAKLTVRSEAQRANAGGAERLARAVILGATLIIILGTLAIFVAFHRNVTRPVEEAIGFADRVAKGDLTARADSAKMGQAGRLLAALSDMSRSLGQIVADVRRSTDSIEGSSSRLADGNDHLSQRTEQQASSLEETAASMEELSAAVAENAESARLASEKARHARATAARGGEVIGQFATRMEAIQAGSNRIAEIIGVIDGIAFQTNILALNAAVEAARAGEQGRGFAVVAAEVRALALRSGTAAKEIKQVIRESAEQIGGGAAMVEASRQTMEDIGAAVDEMVRIIGQIDLASTEQTNSIRQISSVIVQLEQTVQHNAALVGEISTASQGLRNEAGGLKQAVRVFTIDDPVDAARPRRRTPDASGPRAAGLQRQVAGRLARAPEALTGRSDAQGGTGES